MIKKKIMKSSWVPLFIFLLVSISGSAQSKPVTMSVTVKTILAARGQKYEDARIPLLIEQLKSVFGYTSYRLLSYKEMKMRIGKQDVVLLPGKRLLKVVPTKIIKEKTEYRLELHIAIFNEEKRIFQKVVKLKNRNCLTVGGPKHQGGVLLFNIYTEF